MNSKITAQIEFYFKGEKIAPEVTLDLDELMEAQGQLPSLRQQLATAHQIDPYSYEFEVMEATPVTISQAEGMVCDHIDADRHLNIESFQQQWHQNKIEQRLQSIARKRLGLEAVPGDDPVMQALLDAYTLGKTSGH